MIMKRAHMTLGTLQAAQELIRTNCAADRAGCDHKSLPSAGGRNPTEEGPELPQNTVLVNGTCFATNTPSVVQGG